MGANILDIYYIVEAVFTGPYNDHDIFYNFITQGVLRDAAYTDPTV